MKHTLLCGIALIVVSTSVGCVSVRSSYYGSSLRSPRPDGPVEILEVQDIHQPYRVIGSVEVAAYKGHNLMGIVERLKDAARKMGGEALTDLQYRPVGMGVPVSEHRTMYVGYVRDLWSAKVIVWERP